MGITNLFCSRTMHFWAPISVILVGLLASCAEYKAASVPMLAQDIPKASVAGADYEVFITSFSDPKKQETYFDTNFQEAGLIALQVSVKNNSMRDVLVRRSTMTLELPGGERILPASPNTAAIHVGEEGSVVGATIAFGVIGGIAATQAEDAARTARISDYENKGFKDSTLGKGESAQGFVFFIPSTDTKPFDQSHLNVIFTDLDSAIGTTVRTEVRGINFTGNGENDGGNAIVTAGPTQTSAFASANLTETKTPSSLMSQPSVRHHSSAISDPDHASAVKKVEERYERLISPQRRQRYSLGCDKSAKQARTQGCQDVNLQIQLLEEARDRELLALSRRFQRAPLQESGEKNIGNRATETSPTIDYASDKIAISEAIQDYLDITGGGDSCWGDINVVPSGECTLHEFQVIEVGKIEGNKIVVTGRYVLESRLERRPFISNFALLKNGTKFRVISVKPI